jgi:citronellyl-CoA synthetase
MDKESKIINVDTLRFRDLVPGLLQISWRIPSILINMIRYLGYKGDTALSMGTVLEHHARKYPNNTAILYEDIRLTHKEFNEAINRYAHYFISQGMKKGDTAIVMLDNRPELLMIIGSMSKIGAVSSLINPNQRGGVLLNSINLTKGRVFIIGEELLEAFEEIKPELKLTGDDLVLFVPDRGLIPTPTGYLNLQDEIKNSPSTNPPTVSEVTLQDPFAYVFTSGTTGLPKASVQTHKRWFGGMYLFGKMVMNLKPKDIHYCSLPFCHTNALNVSWGACASKGTAMAIRRKFSVTNFWNDIRKFNANSFIYIGELCRYLMNQPEIPDDRKNPVKKIVGNGLRPEIWKNFKKRFNIPTVYEFYGAAEGPLIFSNLLNLDCTIGCCLTPFAIVKYDIDTDEPIRDENGYMQRVSRGESGLLLAVISEGIPFAGYTDKKETEKKVFRDVFEKGDAWFNFGDMLRNLGFKHAQFVDRLGDTFRWKGENVSTNEVEKIINTLPQVSQSTVYGVIIPGTDGRAGMVSIIPTKSAEDFDLRSLADTVQKALPSYAVPKFVRFKKEFETTGTLKIKKTVLRDEGFDPHRVADPLYVLLPESSEYQPLTVKVFDEILSGKYRF